MLDDDLLAFSGGARPRKRRRKVRDATTFLARLLVTRAVRAAGAHQVLRGGPGVVGLLLEHPEDSPAYTAAMIAVLKDTARNQPVIDYRSFNWTSIKTRRLATTWDDHLAEGDQDVFRVLALADASEGLSASFLACADGVVDVGRPDPAMLRVAFRALGAMDPASLPDAKALAAIPLGAYASILRRGASSGAAAKIARLAEACAAGSRGRSDEAADSGPTLDDLHGLGEASGWGRQLAVDLADFKAGKLAWRDVDRGILLSGPPGTGKTTFARALGRSCAVPVFVHSLARWQAAGYLNDLLRSMRSAFAEAQAAAPSILFVDELDSFGDRAKLEGKNRQYGVEVINGFLECVDGADRRTGVVVVGATNDAENVDPAIKRAGRLDKHVSIRLPDAEARAGILRHHLGADVPGCDLDAIVVPLEGMSGADLEKAVRNARRIARTAKRPMTPDDLRRGLPNGIELSAETFRRSCVHEAGHLVVGTWLARETASVPVLARVSRTVVGNEGGTTNFRRDEAVARTRESYLAEITVYLAGLAAERVVFGSNSHGGGGLRGSDLHKATCLAVAIEVSLGLGDRLAFLDEFNSDALPLHLQRDPRLRETVEATLAACMDRATELLRRRREGFDEVARIIADEGEATLADACKALGSGPDP